MKRIIALGALVLISVACTVITRQDLNVKEPTQLETREFQTRTFDTNNVKLILKAVVNTLQDDGFIIKNAVVDLGLISATKEIDLTKSKQAKSNGIDWGDVFVGVFSKQPRHSNNQREETFSKLKIIEASINVSEYGKQCKVRANFQAKILDNTGAAVEVKTIDDGKFYQEFFSKVDKGVFLQKQGL